MYLQMKWLKIIVPYSFIYRTTEALAVTLKFNRFTSQSRRFGLYSFININK